MEQLITPCVLQTIIICSTIIIAGTVGVSWYRVYKGQNKTASSYIFSASVLTILAITIFSYCFYGNRNVLDFISLASALISIVLAIVTIIYSFYSNSRSTGQIETLNNAAKSVENATLSYSQTAESLQENIEKIIAAVTRVEAKTDKLLEGKMASNTSSSADWGNFNLDIYIKGFIANSSPLGNLAIYACIKSKDTGKKLNLNLFSNRDYCGGFLVSTTSTGLVTLYIDFNTGEISVLNYISQVKDHILSWVQGFNFASIGVQDVKNNIDAYFAA